MEKHKRKTEMLRNRRATMSLTWGGIIEIALGLFVLIILIYAATFMLGGIFRGAFGDGGPGNIAGRLANGTGFTPYQTQLTQQEKAVDDSMNALVRAINGAAKGETVSQNTITEPDNIPDADVREKIGWFRIEYWGEVEFVGDILNTKIYSQRTFSGERMFESLNPYVYVYDSDVLAQHPEYTDQKKIDGFDQVNNIGLYVEYTDGTPPCNAQTEKSEKKYTGSDLKTYTLGDPLGCAASPTILECPYLKIYYCGKKGHITASESGTGKAIYYKEGHSTAYARFLLSVQRTGQSSAAQSQRDSFFDGVGNTFSSIGNTFSDASYYINPWATDYYSLPAGTCAGGVAIGGAKVSCDANDKSCMVCNFQLPQENTGEEWIAAFGKPKYLVYYQQFPIGPDAHWKFDLKDSLWEIGKTTVISGGLEFLGGKLIGSSINKVGKNMGKEAGELLLRQSGEHLLAGLAAPYGKEGVETFAKRALLSKTLFNEYGETLGTEAVKSADDLFERTLLDVLTRNRGASTLKPLAQVEKEAVEEFEQKLAQELGARGVQDAPAVAKGIASKASTTMGMRVSHAALTETMMQISYANMLDTLVQEGTERLSQEAVNTAFEQAFKQVNNGFTKLPKVYQEQALKQAEKRIATQFSKEGEFLTLKAIDNPGLAVDIAAEGLGSRLTDFGKTAVETMGAGVRRPLDFVPTGGWVDGPISPIILTLKPSKLLSPVAQSKQMAQWFYGKRYTFLLATSFVSEGIDNQYSHYVPIGSNALAVSTPTFLGAARVYQLDPAAQRYYIALHERYQTQGLTDLVTGGHVPTRRFYMISPCTTDLKVERTTCKCFRQPENYHYNFGGGYIDVVTGTISLTNAGLSGADYQQIERVLKSKPSDNLLSGNIQGNPLFKNNVDTSLAVKQCMGKDAMQSAKQWWGEWTSGSPAEYEEYQTECLLIKPRPYTDSTDAYNYCYARFPGTESWKRTIGAISIMGNLAIQIATGGAALPAVVPIAMAGAAMQEAITQFAEKWPHNSDSSQIDRSQYTNAAQLNG